ncbi:MAG: ATP-binding protein, partial [Motiliproteus sp.]|nr:ATP-binding protein [Motiliproteus sp.]
QIISHQLGRATTTSIHHLLKPVDLIAIIKRIGNALEKVYQSKFKSFDVEGSALQFKGDERDLMEILGNLIDNAFKYGNGQVRVTVSQQQETLLIAVEDDGNGVSEQDSDAIQQRGTRADSLEPGQGIGLSVVRDILNGYDGQLEVSRSELGGAQFQLKLPLN